MIRRGIIAASFKSAPGSIVLTIATTGASEVIAIPANDIGVYNAIIDWGDGSPIANITTYDDADLTHTYAVAGDHIVTITGTAPNLPYYNGGTYTDTLKSVVIGDINATSMASCFYGCSNLTSVTATDLSATSNVTDLKNAFDLCTSLTTIPEFDTGNVTNFDYAWYLCYNLPTSFPLFDTSSGTTFYNTWAFCGQIANFPEINTINGENFNSTWRDCSDLLTFPLLNTSKGENFRYSWQNCSGLTSFPALDFSNGTEFTGTWINCSSLTSFPANMFDTCTSTIFSNAFLSTNLDAESKDNILVSLDTAGQSNGTLTITGGPLSGNAGALAWANLQEKGWTGTVDAPASIHFSMTIATTGASETVSIPADDVDVYNATIDWGDGSPVADVTTYNDTDLTHEYVAAGDHTVTISGTAPALPYYNDVGDKLTLKSVVLGDIGIVRMTGAFYGCNNLESITAPDLSVTQNVTIFYRAWTSCTSLTTFPLLDTGLGEDFRLAWENCSGLTTFPLLDTGLGESFYGTWTGCTSLTTFPLLNTSSGTNFHRAWKNCTSLTTFSLLNTELGTVFHEAWRNCSGLTTFPLLDIGLGEDFTLAWADCILLTTFPLLNTSSGTDFEHTWTGCTSLTTFSANMFDTCAATNFTGAFTNTLLNADSKDNILVSLDTANEIDGTLDITGGPLAGPDGALAWANLQEKGWTGTVLAPSYILTLTAVAATPISIPAADVGSYDATIDWGDGTIEAITLYNDEHLTHTYASSGDFNVAISGTAPALPYYNNVGDKLTLKSVVLGDTGITTLEGGFRGCNNLESITAPDLSVTQNVTNFYRAWADCTSLTTFPLLDTSSGTSFNSAWNTCSGLTSFPLLDTSSGTNFYGAWRDCSGLTSFPLLNTGLGENFTSAWRDCTLLTTFPLLNTGLGENFTSAWENCSGLTTFPLLNTSSGTFFTSAWRDCTSLTTFPANMFDSCGATFFTNAFLSTNLDAESKDNILVSLDTAGQSNGTLTITGGPLSGNAGAVAWANLQAKGWTGTVDAPAPIHFSMTIATTGASETVSIPANDIGVYNATIDWGDGSPVADITTYDDADLTHTFANIDSHDIIIEGTAPALPFFNNAGDKTKLYAVNLGSGLGWTNWVSAFRGCTNLSTLDVPSPNVTIDIEDFTSAFRETGIIDFPLINTSNATTLYATWYACAALESMEFIDTSNVSNFEYAWGSCTSLVSFPAIDVSGATELAYSWDGCTGLTSFPVLDLSNITSIVGAWKNCTGLTSFPVLDFSNKTSIVSAWRGCTGLTSFPVLDLSNTTSISSTWRTCEGLTSFPTINTSNIEDFSSAWNGCTGLTSFPVLDFSSATNCNLAWYDCTELTTFPANVFDDSLCTSFAAAWAGCDLDQQGMDNILISLDTAGQIDGELDIYGAVPSSAGLTAWSNLQGKGWTGYVPVT